MVELARTPSIIETTNNISDVLASIRRLIAQDEAGRQPDPVPDYPLDLLDEPVVAEEPLDDDTIAFQRHLSTPLVLRPTELRFDEPALAPRPANLATPVEDATAQVPAPLDELPPEPEEVLPAAIFQTAAETEEPSPHLFAMDDEELATEKLIRTIIRETVLQELRGDLGSRVSRNIRDLVRAEIGRALDGLRSNA